MLRQITEHKTFTTHNRMSRHATRDKSYYYEGRVLSAKIKQCNPTVTHIKTPAHKTYRENCFLNAHNSNIANKYQLRERNKFSRARADFFCIIVF